VPTGNICDPITSYTIYFHRLNSSVPVSSSIVNTGPNTGTTTSYTLYGIYYSWYSNFASQLLDAHDLFVNNQYNLSGKFTLVSLHVGIVIYVKMLYDSCTRYNGPSYQFSTIVT